MAAVIPANAIESFDVLYERASLRIRTTQALRTLPVVVLSLIALEFALRGRVSAIQLHLWELLMAGVTMLRAALSSAIRPRLEHADPVALRRYEGLLWASAVINALVIGSAFWLVAASGDLTVRLVVTLISCFYAIGALVNASSHFPSFAVVTCLHLSQGVLFWLGVGSAVAPQFAIALPYFAVAVLMLGFGREYSHQFRDSLRIRTENTELLAQLAADKRVVESALEEARLASESKSRFLAAASHDLRQPLHALTMFLGTLTFHVTGDDAKRLLGRIHDTADLLEEQFNSLLDLSRFDVGAITPDIKTFRLDSLVERLVEDHRPDAEAKRLELTAMTQAAVAMSDRILVGRVIRNLIENAVKYTMAGSITVAVTQQGGHFVVEVIDTGPGIPAEQQARIFEEYVQLSNPGRQRRLGVGLGLAIAKRIDTLLGLQLSVSSTPGAGSKFRFQVASADPDDPPPTTIHMGNPVTFSTSATIWVLDDDPIVLEALREQLSVWGARVATYTDPLEMLRDLRSSRALPNWIITDDMLGSALSGLETAQVLSTQFGYCNVCLMTGNTEPGRLAQLRASRFPVLVKPARPEVLMAIISD